MQKSFIYYLIEPMGKNFDPEFSPELTPKQMLEMGVFGGKYMTDCSAEYPKIWYTNAKLCHEIHISEVNFFRLSQAPAAVQNEAVEDFGQARE